MKTQDFVLQMTDFILKMMNLLQVCGDAWFEAQGEEQRQLQFQHKKEGERRPRQALHHSGSGTAKTPKMTGEIVVVGLF